MAKKATGRTSDDRVIHYAVRLPGTGVGKDWPKKSTGKFNKGAVIVDPDELAALAEEGKVDLKALAAKGVISGNWKGLD